MKDKFIGIGGAIFAVGLVAIPAIAAIYYVVAPIICWSLCNTWSAGW